MTTYAHCYWSAKRKSDYIIKANNRYGIRKCHCVYVCHISLTLFEMGTLSRDSTMMVESIKGNERLVGKIGKDRHMNIDYKLKAFERVQSYRVWHFRAIDLYESAKILDNFFGYKYHGFYYFFQKEKKKKPMHHSSSEENHFQSFVFLINLYYYIVIHCREYISMNLVDRSKIDSQMTRPLSVLLPSEYL